MNTMKFLKLIYLAGVLLVINAFLFFPVFTNADTITIGNQQTGRADYSNSGVDKSITAFLCTPTDISSVNVATTPGSILLDPSVATQNPAGQDLYNCINKLYRFGIAFGAIAGIFFIVLAGYYYISGSEAAISKAKGYVGGVIVGLLIMLTSFILLKQINPDLVRFRPIQPPQFTDPCGGQFGQGNCAIPTCEQFGLSQAVCDENEGTNPSTGAAVGGGGSWGNPHAETTCSGNLGQPQCPNLLDLGISCKDGRNYCYIQKIIADRLVALKQYTDSHGGPAWTVAEAFGQGGAPGKHAHSCHEQTGSCVDMVTIAGSGSSYAQLCNAIKAVGGLLFKNEVESSTAETTRACGAFIQTKFGKGDHLHVGVP